MKSNKNSSLRVGLILATITALSLTLIFTVSGLTHEAIIVAKDYEQNQRFASLIPADSYNNSPIRECYLVPGFGAEPKEVYVARMDGIPTGYVINYDVTGGYSTPFKMVAGVTANGSINYVDIVEFNETPGLGDKVLRSKGAFLDNFNGASLANRKFEVKKFGGDFDYYTGATITPRAIVRSTKAMLTKLSKLDLSTFPKCEEAKAK